MSLNFKYVEDVASYFSVLVDETDQTFMPTDILQHWLQIGYNQYYQWVSDHDSDRFALQHSWAQNGSDYDMNGVLLGPAAPDATRLLQLIRIVSVDASGIVGLHYRAVNNLEQLDTVEYVEPKYYLQGTKIYFDSDIQDTLRLDYIPAATVDWTKTTSGDNEWIDDLLGFHDLIALFAAQQYFASDSQPNPLIDRLTAIRSKAFVEQLARGRSISANRFVHSENPFW